MRESWEESKTVSVPKIPGKPQKKKRKKEKEVIIDIFGLVIVFLFSACYNNMIGFDPDTNTVFSVDNYPIKTLDVVMENSKMSFYIANVDTLEASSRIKLDSLGKNYRIVKEKSDFPPQERYENIPFVPSEKYEIYHASGDASSCVIYIFTDENGRVNKVKKWFEENN